MTTLDGLLTETLHSDQARRLRGLVEQRQQHRLAADNSTTTTATVIAVTSGKGGVGKSCLALNLSIALARLDVRVALLDTSLGLGHLDLMCGLNGYWNLGHVLAGTRRLPEITLEGPSGIHVIPGAGRLSKLPDGDKPINPDVSEQLVSLETGHDVLVLDTGHWEHPFVVNCLSASDTVLVVTTPEPTALADAYATFKAMSRGASGHLQTLVNRAESAKVAEEIHQRLVRTTRIFLEAEPPLAGWIPDDPEMAQAIHSRTPLMAQAPDSPAGRAISQLAARLVYHSPKSSESVPFFQQLFKSNHHQDNTPVSIN